MSATRYYLSEMSVSHKHGGGLTLQRVLQDDLSTFRLFVHLHEFATEIAPIEKRFADRQWNLHHEYPVPHVASRSTRGYVDRVLARLRMKTTLLWSMDRWSRRLAARIRQRIPLEGSCWLVVPQNVQSVLVMNHVYRNTPVRYVTWVMDDHVARWKNGVRYPPTFESEFRFHLRHAQRVFVISPAMQSLYRNRFGVEAEVLFGPADAVSQVECDNANPKGPVRLAYFGAIREWQHDALALLVTNLSRADATLDVFGLQDPPLELRSSRVCVRSPVPAGDVMSRMRAYDGVVVPASYRDSQRPLTELNIATKMSECFASGTVPVIVAPAYAAMVRFAMDHGGALVVSDFDDPVQINALRNLKAPDVRKRVLEDARQVVEMQCSSAVMRRRWRSAWHGDGADSPLHEYPASHVLSRRLV